MRKVFENTGALTCIFTEEGVSLYGKKNEAFYPYGCMDSICVTLFGELQIKFGFNLVTFVAEKPDRPEMRKTVKEVKPLLKTAPYEEPKVYMVCSKVPSDLPVDEQMHQYKLLFSTGTISKGYYDLKKRLLQDR